MWWWKGKTEKSEPQETVRRSRIAWLAASTSPCCLESCCRQSVEQPAERVGGGLLLGDVCTKTGQPVADVLWEKHPGMRVPPVENHMCTEFEENEEVPETVPLDFSEEDIT